MTIDNRQEAARYGNLVRVAIGFHISTGNPAELDAAVCYTRAAAYFANRELNHTPDPLPPAAVWHETIGGDADTVVHLSAQVLVF